MEIIIIVTYNISKKIAVNMLFKYFCNIDQYMCPWCPIPLVMMDLCCSYGIDN